MTNVMTPSREPMKDGQIDKAVDHYRNLLKKHRDEIGSSDAVQQVLGQPDYLAEQLAVIRRRVKAVSDLIVRRVTVDRTRTPQAMLDATGQKQYTDPKVVAAMPRGEGSEADVYIFKPRPEAYKNGVISDDDLDKEFEFVGLVPADPYTLGAVNEADQAFANKHYNATHWKNANGKWCYAAFFRWGDERLVRVNQRAALTGSSSGGSRASASSFEPWTSALAHSNPLALVLQPGLPRSASLEHQRGEYAATGSLAWKRARLLF